MRLPLVTALIALLAAVPAADAKPRKRCKLRGGTVVAKSKRAVVFARTTDSFPETETVVYGCLRKNGRLARVASESSSQYAGSSLGHLTLRGTFVAASRRTGVTDGSCQAGVGVYSLAKRHESHSWGFSGHESTGCSTVDGLVLGPRGRAAFAEKKASGVVALHKLDGTGHHLVDQGQIYEDTISIDGPVGNWSLNWTNGPTGHSTRVF